MQIHYIDQRCHHRPFLTNPEYYQNLEGLHNFFQIQDVPTRWNSTHDMLDRITQHKQSVSDFVKTRPQLSALTETEWEKAKTLVSILAPVKEATESLGGEQFVSVSSLLPTLSHLEHAMKPQEDTDPGFAVRYKEVFIRKLKERTALYYCHTSILLATLLDPRHKRLRCLSKQKRTEVVDMLRAKILSSESESRDQAPAKKSRFCYGDDDDNECSDAAMGVQVSDVDLYLRMPDAGDDECPLAFWKQQGNSLSQLVKHARSLLAMPATSVPCERLFSAAGHVVTKHRASLSPDTAKQIICLKHWMP